MQCCLRVEWQKVRGHGGQGLGLLRDEELGRRWVSNLTNRVPAEGREAQVGSGQQKVVSAR